MEPLNRDIKYLQDKYQLSVPATTPEATQYADFLLNLAEKNAPVCALPACGLRALIGLARCCCAGAYHELG